MHEAASGPGVSPGAGEDWRGWFWAIWAVACVYLLYNRFNAIHWFALSDTDDNMRYAQVTAWLNGQGWYDLRAHRMDPPAGASIHWSRIVDLPIAGLILLLRPFLGGADAGRWACAVAPLLALGACLYATMLAARRLVGAGSEPLAAAILLCAASTMAMFQPLRIDHHGWQLATLMTAIAGMADPRPLRGGIVAGLATATSLAIGLELMPYLATTGALILLWWALDRAQGPRLIGYGLSLAGGAVVGYLAFASYDNASPRCDALTPVYLSTLVEAGLLAALAGALPLRARWQRLAAGAVAGALVAATFALAWPQCLGRPEQISPELDRLWFSHIREAKPLYQHSWRVWFPTIALSLVGLAGALAARWRARGTIAALPWTLVSLLSLFACALLLWQTRAAPASQAVGAIGATALGHPLITRALGYAHPSAWRGAVVRVGGTVAAFLLASGALAGLIVRAVPEHKTAYRAQVDTANRRCPTLPALNPIAKLPPATILTFVDLGPRLLAVTHHSVVAGPYHRAGDAILDVHHAFRSPDPAVARAVMRAHGATLLLLCPGMSESTVYRSEARAGFYGQLSEGRVPAWLAPVPLPKGSPFRLWRRVG